MSDNLRENAFIQKEEILGKNNMRFRKRDKSKNYSLLTIRLRSIN